MTSMTRGRRVALYVCSIAWIVSACAAPATAPPTTAPAAAAPTAAATTAPAKPTAAPAAATTAPAAAATTAPKPAATTAPAAAAAPSGTPIKVGVMDDVTGVGAIEGALMRISTDLVVQRTNASGGINGHPLKRSEERRVGKEGRYRRSP